MGASENDARVGWGARCYRQGVTRIQLGDGYHGSHAMNPIEISAILVTYNNEAHIKRCLTTLSEALSTYSWELVVWDNCSLDSTTDLIKAHTPPGCLVTHHSANVGFAAAVNAAVGSSSGRYLLLVNPDTEVPCDAPQLLHDALESDSSIGVAGALIHSQYGSRLAGGGWAPSVPRMLSEAFALPSLLPMMSKTGIYARRCCVPGSGAYAVDWVAGTFLMTSRQTWDAAGGMSEQWFMYCEDIDFGMRVQAQGMRAVLVPSVRVFHVGGGSDPGGSSTASLQVSAIRDIYEIWADSGLVRKVLFDVALWLYFAGRFLTGVGQRSRRLRPIRLSASRSPVGPTRSRQ